MKKMYSIGKEKGITLIALVITIVVLIILAAVIISLTLDKNGIFNRAKEAASEYDLATAEETINLEITNGIIETESNLGRGPTLKELADMFCENDTVFEYVLEQTNIASLEKISNDNPSCIYVKLRAFVYEFVINKDLEVISISDTKTNQKIKNGLDEEPPTTNVPTISNATETSFTITCNQQDLKSGISKREYSIDNGNTWVIMTSNPQEVTGLTASTTYQVKTRATDNAENVATTDAVSAKTEAPLVTVTAADYGKKVNEYAATGWSGDWRVFYKDNNYVFIISNTATTENYDETSKYTTTAPTSSYLWQNYMSLINFNSNYNSHKAIAGLMTTGNWDIYKDAEGKAEFAVGAVPLEMYISSIDATQGKDWSLSWGSKNYGYVINGTGRESEWSTTPGTLNTNMNKGIYLLNNLYTVVAGPLELTTDSFASLNGFSAGNCLGVALCAQSHKNEALRPMVAIPVNNFRYTLS